MSSGNLQMFVKGEVEQLVTYDDNLKEDSGLDNIIGTMTMMLDRNKYKSSERST